MLTCLFNKINNLADYGTFCSAATQHLVVAADVADVADAAMRQPFYARGCVSGGVRVTARLVDAERLFALEHCLECHRQSGQTVDL